MKSLFAHMLVPPFGGGLLPRHYIDISIMYVNFIFFKFLLVDFISSKKFDVILVDAGSY
jgi:hypothetical protein